jgi:Zn-dependent M16 (insulinase) family peptidase
MRTKSMHFRVQALDLLGTYLTSSAVAPLNKEFIETESPLWYEPVSRFELTLIQSCSSYIYFGEETRASRVDLPIYVGSIPTEHLGDFNEKLKVSFERIITEGIDMGRMAMVLNRDERQVIQFSKVYLGDLIYLYLLQLRSKLESAKGDTFSATIITDFLYGAEDGSYLKDSMDEINQYAELRQWSSDQWTNLLQK